MFLQPIATIAAHHAFKSEKTLVGIDADIVLSGLFTINDLAVKLTRAVHKHRSCPRAGMIGVCEGHNSYNAGWYIFHEMLPRQMEILQGR